MTTTKRAMLAALVTRSDAATLTIKTSLRPRHPTMTTNNNSRASSSSSRVLWNQSPVAPLSSAAVARASQERATFQQAAWWLRLRRLSLALPSAEPAVAEAPHAATPPVPVSSPSTREANGSAAVVELKNDPDSADDRALSAGCAPAAGAERVVPRDLFAAQEISATANGNATTAINDEPSARADAELAQAQQVLRLVRERLAETEAENSLLRGALKNAMRKFVVAKRETAFELQRLETRATQASDRARRSQATVSALKQALQAAQSSLQAVAKTSVASIARRQRQSESLAAAYARLQAHNDQLQRHLRQQHERLERLWQLNLSMRLPEPVTATRSSSQTSSARARAPALSSPRRRQLVVRFKHEEEMDDRDSTHSDGDCARVHPEPTPAHAADA
ncbi:hypothetical protein P43SY_004597 [Pythium insidiosum]|uniref:Uncharacterized protein n=1 Tax=Pythium insidiosum TaxID=114742 RepID=A0AAD5LL63_PYTIN|nr:hypothetical protein P43SY_004597 [Pythium insidiosum]